jgi:hypothetical protein
MLPLHIVEIIRRQQRRRVPGPVPSDSVHRIDLIERASPGRLRYSIPSSISIPRQIALAASINASLGIAGGLLGEARAIVRAMN